MRPFGAGEGELASADVALGFAALFVGCAPEPPPRYVVVCLDPTGVVVSCDGEPAPAAGALDAGEAL